MSAKYATTRYSTMLIFAMSFLILFTALLVVLCAAQSPADWRIRLDYRTSPLNPENSSLQYRNSPLNWQNSPLNPASPQLRSPTTGEPLGYVVPRADGGINVFAPNGQWIGVQP